MKQDWEEETEMSKDMVSGMSVFKLLGKHEQLVVPWSESCLEGTGFCPSSLHLLVIGHHCPGSVCVCVCMQGRARSFWLPQKVAV